MNACRGTVDGTAELTVLSMWPLRNTDATELPADGTTDTTVDGGSGGATSSVAAGAGHGDGDLAGALVDTHVPVTHAMGGRGRRATRKDTPSRKRERSRGSESVASAKQRKRAKDGAVTTPSTARLSMLGLCVSNCWLAVLSILLCCARCAYCADGGAEPVRVPALRR